MIHRWGQDIQLIWTHIADRRRFAADSRRNTIEGLRELARDDIRGSPGARGARQLLSADATPGMLPATFAIPL